MKSYFKVLGRSLVIVFIALMANENLAAQTDKKFTQTVVFEVNNFSEEKMLTAINSYILPKGGARVWGYCPGQELVAFKYDPKIYPEAEDLMVFLLDKGFIVYMKDHLTMDDAVNQCKYSFKYFEK